MHQQDPLYEAALSMARDLIRIESTNPGALEEGVADHLKRYFAGRLPEWGKLTVSTADGGRPVLMAELPGRSERTLALICHMDTVPVANGWTMDPFCAEIRDGKLYGLGSADMKSGLSSACTAFTCVARKLDSEGRRPEHTIRFLASMDEEADMKGVEEMIRLGWVSPDTLVLDTEPTGGMIQTAHKGRYWFRYTMHGKAAHASRPEDGADAIAGMAAAITSIRRRILALRPDPFLGPSTVAFGMIQGGIHPYQVPDTCTVSVDVRLVPPYTKDDLVRILEAGCDAARKELGRETLTCTIECTGERPPVPHHEDSELLGLMRDAVRSATGAEPVVGPFPGYTDTAVIAGMLGNCNCMSYGPGKLAQAHRPDEYAALADIRRCCHVYRELLGRWAEEETDLCSEI